MIKKKKRLNVKKPKNALKKRNIYYDLLINYCVKKKSTIIYFDKLSSVLRRRFGLKNTFIYRKRSFDVNMSDVDTRWPAPPQIPKKLVLGR